MYGIFIIDLYISSINYNETFKLTRNSHLIRYVDEDPRMRTVRAVITGLERVESEKLAKVNYFRCIITTFMVSISMKLFIADAAFARRKHHGRFPKMYSFDYSKGTS